MNRSGRIVALVLLAALALMAVAGPWFAPAIAGFSPEEQHTAFPYSAPGFADVPEAHPSFDGRPDAFALLDPAGSGRLACSARNCPALEPVAAAARVLSRVLADAWQGHWPVIDR